MRALMKFCTARLEMMSREKDWVSQCGLSRLLCEELVQNSPAGQHGSGRVSGRPWAAQICTLEYLAIPPVPDLLALGRVHL